MPVASGLSAGTGAESLPGGGLAPDPPLAVGEFDGVFCAGDVPDEVGVVDGGVLVGVPLGDVLPDMDGLPLGDVLPDGDVLGDTDPVGEQLGVVPVDPPPRWPPGVVPPWPLVPV